MQLAVILATARVLAFLLGRLRQPPVIGEMIAGIVTTLMTSPLTLFLRRAPAATTDVRETR